MLSPFSPLAEPATARREWCASLDIAIFRSSSFDDGFGELGAGGTLDFDVEEDLEDNTSYYPDSRIPTDGWFHACT